MADANNGKRPPHAMIRLSASCEIKWTVLTTNIAFSLLLTKSSTDFVEWLLQTWMSVSKENSTSDSSLWWIYDHLNSGIRNGGLVGPGLNIGLVDAEPDLERLASPINKKENGNTLIKLNLLNLFNKKKLRFVEHGFSWNFAVIYWQMKKVYLSNLRSSSILKFRKLAQYILKIWIYENFYDRTETLIGQTSCNCLTFPVIAKKAT